MGTTRPNLHIWLPEARIKGDSEQYCDPFVIFCNNAISYIVRTAFLLIHEYVI